MEPSWDETGDAGNGEMFGTSEPTRAQPIQRSAGSRGPAPFSLASYYERAVVLHRLKDGLAAGRLDDDVFDHRMRAALTARTHGELEPLIADLPGAPQPAATAARPAWFAVGLKGLVRRAGRWRVPRQHTMIVFRGRGELDLRAAELTAPVTTLLTVGYRSAITVLVPPGVRVQASGPGVRCDLTDLTDSPVPPGAPVVHVRGLAYQGAVEVLARPRAGRPPASRPRG